MQFYYKNISKSVDLSFIFQNFEKKMFKSVKEIEEINMDSGILGLGQFFFYYFMFLLLFKIMIIMKKMFLTYSIDR